MKFLIATTICFVVLACASAPPPEIKDADAKMVEQCTFVGHVNGSSLLGGAVQRTARRHAREDAMREAAKLGATHIVWSSVRSAYYETASAEGDAYRCGGERK